MAKKLIHVAYFVVLLGFAEAALSGTVLQYGFDGASGSDVPSSLVDDTGTYTATIIEGSEPASTIKYAAANPTYNTGGTSAEFTNGSWSNNAGDTFVIPNDGGINFGSFNKFTVELFIYPDSSGSGQTRRIFSEYIYAYMYLDSSSTLHAIRKWGAGKWNENWTHLQLADFPHDTWSHLAMTWDADAEGDKFKLYVNGELAAGDPGTSTPTIDSTAGLTIGGYQREDSSTAQFFAGRVDEFRLSDVALEPTEFVGARPAISFETASSGNLETVSPANITVVLRSAEEGGTYTVNYAVARGTATGGGVDYSLAAYCDCDFDDNDQVNILDIAVVVDNWLAQTPGNIADISGDNSVNFEDFAVCAAEWLRACADATLVFNLGQTSKTISIDIVDDGLDEEDETIIVELLNPTGPNVVPGKITQHTYTIIDMRPKVSFEAESSSGLEDVTPALIAVTLSHAGDQTITVDYAVTGGTATGSGVDYTLAAGTLQFDPGVLTQHVSINITDDDEQESSETIEITLSNPTNATLGQPSAHTYTILDNEQGTFFDGMVWYFSGDNPEGRFEVNAAGQLEWRNLRPPDHVIVQLPDQRFSEPGDVVEVSYWYKGEGGGNIVSGDRGTGDIRTGLFDSNGSCHATPPDLWYTNDCFIGYIGYRIGFSAHASGYGGHIAKRIYPFERSLLQSAEGPYGPNSGQKDINAFGLPRGQWALWTLRLQRTSSSRVVFTVTCNGRTAQLVDDNPQHQPQKIDAFGMYFANVRDYTLVSLATEQPSP